MTERRVAYQVAMFGDPVVAGDIVDRCRAMLAEEPATREDYERAWLHYLALYHGLDSALRAGRVCSVDTLLDWLRAVNAPSFRTVANRCQEEMRADASLQPDREVMDKRQRQRRQGRVR